MHAHRDRTRLELIVFAEVQLYCHLETMHGSGAGLLKTVDPQTRTYRRSTNTHLNPVMAELLDVELLKDLRPHEPASFAQSLNR